MRMVLKLTREEGAGLERALDRIEAGRPVRQVRGHPVAHRSTPWLVESNQWDSLFHRGHLTANYRRPNDP